MTLAARAFGAVPARGGLRRQASDFEVEEIMGFEPDGAGQHVWLWITKQGADTAEVARALAERAAVAPTAVGFAGRKDREAVTRQWFSVDLGGRTAPAWDPPNDGAWRIDTTVRHGRKLRPGTHRANRFRLRVRDIVGDREAVTDRLRWLDVSGFPNYFGAQRFGPAGANLRRARASLRRARRRIPPMQISAARSWLFNRVLAQRVRDGTWNRALVGEALMLAGTRSLFRYDASDTDVPERIAALDVDPTGPLWGRGRLPQAAEMDALEAYWLDDERLLCSDLERFGARADRRPLRTAVEGLDWDWDGGDLVLTFTLRRGAFATSMMAEVIDWGEDATPA